MALVYRNSLSFRLPILMSCEGTWRLLVFLYCQFSVFLTVMSQAVHSKIKVPKYQLCLKWTACFSGCLWGYLDVMDCEPLHANQSISCFFGSLSWLVSIACGVPNLVTLFICHALFYKVNELRFLQEPGVSVEQLVLGTHRW